MTIFNTMKIREAYNFITHLKTGIRDNSEHLNGFNETIKQMLIYFEEDPFLMLGLISPLSDDQSSTDSDQSSTDSDQSSTQSPNDGEDAPEEKPYSAWTTKIKEWFDTIMYLLFRGGDGGGDSSPGITNSGIWWIINSFITAWIKLYTSMDCIPAWLRYTLLASITIFRVYRFISLMLKTYQFDIRWMLPSFTRFSHPYDGERGISVNPLIMWTNPPHIHNWWVRYENSYGINRLKRIRSALGLRRVRGLGINLSFLAKSFADRGLRSLIGADIVTALTRVTTRVYDPISKKYLFYFFHIIIYMGLGVVVWYQVLPETVLGAPCPTGYDTDLLPAFRNPSSIVEGYRKVTYLFTKDITPVVIQTYKNDYLFKDFLCIDIQEDAFPSVEGRHRLLSIGAALMMAVLITTKAIALPA